MFFDSKEIRSELMRIFSVEQLKYSQDLRRDILIVEEIGGNCNYEEIKEEDVKNKFNIFNLRDQQIFSTEIIRRGTNYIHQKESESFFTILYVKFLSQASRDHLNQKEGNDQYKNSHLSNNVMKMSHYFLFNKMTINSIGTYMALVTENLNDNMILIINLKTFRQFSMRSMKEIASFTWHPIEPCCFSYSTDSQTKHYLFSQDNETSFEEVAVIDHSTPSPTAKWVTAPNGQLSLLVTSSHIELYDITYKKLYVKTFAFKLFIDAHFASNSSFFIIYSQEEIFFFNTMTLDFKSYSDFPGIIKEILITENSNYIYVLISKGNDILLYTIYNLSEDNYNISLYQSYNNTHLAYTQSKYKMHYNVYQLLVKIQQLERAELSSDNRRLALLYKSDMGERYLCLYDIANGNSVHQFSILPLILFQSFKGYSIKDFAMSYDYALHVNSIYLNWTDRFISKAMINVLQQLK